MDVKFKALNNKEQLQLHQLQVADYWYKKNAGSKTAEKSAKARKVKLPEKWALTEGIDLYSWQVECLNRYFPSCRGIVKVVTGAGKTFLALALAQKVQNEFNPALKVLITVNKGFIIHSFFTLFLKF